MNAPRFADQNIGARLVKSDRPADRLDEGREAAGNQRRVRTESAHGRDEHERARRDFNPLPQNPLDHICPEPLQERDAFARALARNRSRRASRAR